MCKFSTLLTVGAQYLENIHNAYVKNAKPICCYVGTIGRFVLNE